jgi:hypothetical protein
MKKMIGLQLFTFLLLWLLSIQVVAAPVEAVMDLICVTEAPTTSFLVEQDKDTVKVRVIHHNGVQYAPITNSLITPNDLELLKSQAGLIQSLGDDWSFQWKRSGCNADRSDFFQCVGEAEDVVLNSVKVHPWALTVTDVQETTMWGTYRKKNLSLRFSVEKKGYQMNVQVTMDFQKGDCVSSAISGKSQWQKVRTASSSSFN